MHLVNAVNIRSVEALLTVLIQTVYTFGLGLLLGYLFEFSHSLVGAVVLHFSFNLFNTIIYEGFGGYTNELAFYLSAIVFGVIVGVYAICVYLFYLRKYNLYYRS